VKKLSIQIVEDSNYFSRSYDYHSVCLSVCHSVTHCQYICLFIIIIQISVFVC